MPVRDRHLLIEMLKAVLADMLASPVSNHPDLWWICRANQLGPPPRFLARIPQEATLSPAPDAGRDPADLGPCVDDVAPL